MRSLLLAALCAGAAACVGPDDGALDGEHLVVGRCDDGKDRVFDAFHMRCNFFAVERVGDGAFIRMQPTGTLLNRSDSLVIEIADPTFIAGRVGTPIPIDGAQVRASLTLLGSCTEATQPMIARGGTITFTEFGLDRDDHNAATFEFDLVDLRTGAVVGQKFTGFFDFDIHLGTSYQNFSGLIP